MDWMIPEKLKKRVSHAQFLIIISTIDWLKPFHIEQSLITEEIKTFMRPSA